jgi:hypothetical protein
MKYTSDCSDIEIIKLKYKDQNSSKSFY